MKILLTLFGLMGCYLLGISQNTVIHTADRCGHHMTDFDVQWMNSRRDTIQKHRISRAKAPVSIPLTIHLISRTNQTGVISEQELNRAVEELNEQFAVANVQFFICSTHLIANDDYYDFNKGLETEVTRRYNISGTLNLYFVNNIIGPGGLICGYAYLPSTDKHHMFLTNDCVTQGTTHLHEMGHYLGLYHTHGKFNYQLTDELVNGDNCSTAGDEICDTPADPNVANWIDADCDYAAELRDANGDLFAPDPHNMMSYGHGHCRDYFTAGQYQRISYFAERLRSEQECPSFAVNFSSDQSSTYCSSGLQVQFQSDVAHPRPSQLTYAWDVDSDGVIDYDTVNPLHYYDAPGTYTVTLIVSDGRRDVVEVKSDFVVVRPAIGTAFVDTFDVEMGLSYWSVDNPDDKMTWEMDETNACHAKNAVVRFNNFNYNAIGERDYLTLQRLDLSQFVAPRLSFKLAYAPYDDGYTDQLIVQVSRDCFEEHIENIFWKEGAELATAAPTTMIFTPQQCDDWRTEYIELSDFQSENTLSIRWINVNGYGNYLYLDDISVEDTALPLSGDSGRAVKAIPQPAKTASLHQGVFPNPAHHEIWMDMLLDSNAKVQYSISDVRGVVRISGQQFFVEGQTRWHVDVNKLDAGVYFLQVVCKDYTQTDIFTIY